MQTQTNDSLSKAIAYLGAVEVAPGRIAVPENGRWFIMNPHDVLIIAQDRPDVFTGTSIRMPAWFSPEQRFAWRFIPAGAAVAGNDGAGVYTTQAEAERKKLFADDRIERITADLETGEEVQA
jgi:hypothetical protein